MSLSLKEWINHYGARALERELGVHESCIKHWKRGHCLPSDANKLKIVRLSKNAVSVERMITDFFSTSNKNRRKK